MASLSTDKTGNRRIQVFVNGERKAFRLGSINLRAANTIRVHVEDLATAKASGASPSPKTAGWLKEIDDKLHAKLVRCELVGPRSSGETLGPFLESYVESKHLTKSNTIRNYRTSIKHLLSFFGADCKLRDITPADADRYRSHLESKYAPATVAREVKKARQFFRAATRAKLIDESPFQDVKIGSMKNRARQHFVTLDDYRQVLSACPDIEWRMIVALCRIGGLRCPSEIQKLTWSHVDWDRGTMEVPSPKTEHHDGGASRIVPLFPELAEVLREGFEQAEDGSQYVIHRYHNNVNLSTRFRKIIARAGLEPWPKVFANLRSSRQTELAQVYPEWQVCRIMGNSEKVANDHYLQLLPEHIRAMTQTGSDSYSEGSGTRQNGTENESSRSEFHACFVVNPEENSMSQIPPRGVEPLSSD